MNVEKNFNKYGAYYDLLNSDKDYSAEASAIHNLIQRHGNEPRKILEFGSGTGKHAERLIDEYGYDMEGVELSEEMIVHSQNRGFSTVHSGDIRYVELEKKFDIVLSLFHVMSYQTDNASLSAVFSNASKHLEENGLFIFDFWFTPAVIALGPSCRTKTAENESLAITRSSHPDSYICDNIINVNFEIEVYSKTNESTEKFSEIHKMRHFSIPELDLIGELSGFKRRSTVELLSGKSPTLDTWAVCSIYEKI